MPFWNALKIKPSSHFPNILEKGVLLWILSLSYMLAFVAIAWTPIIRALLIGWALNQRLPLSLCCWTDSIKKLWRNQLVISLSLPLFSPSVFFLWGVPTVSAWSPLPKWSISASCMAWRERIKGLPCMAVLASEASPKRANMRCKELSKGTLVLRDHSVAIWPGFSCATC